MLNEGKILVIDDELFSREYFQKILTKIDCRVVTETTGSEGLKALKTSSYDLVILDIRLPDADGIEILRQIKEMNSLMPVIIITAYGTVENAVRAMKLGAFDFLMKPFDETERVLITIKNAIYQGRLETENLSLKNRLKSEALFSSIIGRSESMQRVFELIKKASEVDSNVLVQGESGTGKELMARAIHMNSLRKKSVFLAVDCGALPENLLETTLFGYERGAFTGAFKTTNGYFEEADGGTLFLDEIGEASSSLQVRLLRCLQEKEVEDPKRDLAGTISRAGKECLRIITTVLNCIKDPYLTFAKTDVHEVLTNSLQALREQFGGGLDNVSVKTVMDPRILPTLGDGIQLKQCFLNILTNAVQAMQPVGGTLQIETKHDEMKKEVKIIFSDTGTGIPKEYLNKIFLPFISLKKDGHQHGLGLSFAYQIVKNHGGHIRVDSDVGRGSIFTITLPVS